MRIFRSDSVKITYYFCSEPDINLGRCGWEVWTHAKCLSVLLYPTVEISNPDLEALLVPRVFDFFFFFEIRSLVAQTDRKLAMYPRLALNF